MPGSRPSGQVVPSEWEGTRKRQPSKVASVRSVSSKEQRSNVHPVMLPVRCFSRRKRQPWNEVPRQVQPITEPSLNPADTNVQPVRATRMYKIGRAHV